MKDMVTVRLDGQLNKQLTGMAKRTGRRKSDIIRDALRKQLAIDQFNQIRTKVLPFAESEGLLTDEDIVNRVS